VPAVPSELRRLRAGDEPLLFDFLDRHVDTSLFLISNAEHAGLEDHGRPLQGTYVAHLEDGAVTAVACHCWNGNVLLQGQRGLEEAVLGAVDRTGRPIKGLMGTVPLVARAREALGLTAAPARLEESERLLTLELAALRVPPLLSQPSIECRIPTAAEVAGPLAAYREVYLVETLHTPRTPELLATARAQVEGWHRAKRLWILADGGHAVSMTAFSANARGVVLVGGVYTPSELRGRGYARAAVAGSLLHARDHGSRRSVLFTPESNVPAQRTYRALGYEDAGDWGLVLF
jgi:GNAT superfamily N-acetyltransferase